ncbi:sulfotransferase family 2 domain-containing protein [Alteromonas sp. 345S023]|uniref:Sulfotransferase family 2 domain-containing protein n=1 Tax=Alteromonas profundi TaxID=2696062 RepID=A0A7X5LJQ0_9ALTE|nr:sulfotransferase family 2 domain-containing protein [Alteromonas profundi]NDV89965.1 sulfotransferase family 2 domain-containing protein [Alteromonas profundi]
MPLYLNEQQSVLFLHIPKTGGTTIESWLADSGKYEQLLFSQKKLDDLKVTPQHFGYETLIKITNGLVRPHEYKFAIVRNPFDRIVSEFFYRVKLNNIDLGRKPEELFSSWVIHNLTKYKRNNAIFDNHLRPQSYFVSKGVEVFRFEDGIQNAINTIGEKLGIEVIGEVKAKKVSCRKEILWSEASAKLVLEIYAEDFKKFKYPRDTYKNHLNCSYLKNIKNNAIYIYHGLKRKI